MNIEDIKKNPTPIYKLLVTSDSTQAIVVSEEDVDSLLDGASDISIRTVDGDNLKEAVSQLGAPFINGRAVKKAIIVIRCAETYNLPVSDLSAISAYIDEYISLAVVRWGIGIRHTADKNVTVTSAMTI